MASRPLQIAFTALTLSLVVSLSLWVLHASYEQIRFSEAITLQVPSSPAEINSHEVQESLRSETKVVDPFSQLNSQPQMVQLDEIPNLEGIETAPVSQSLPVGENTPPFPSGDEIEELPDLPFSPPMSEPPSVEDPFELPELSLPELDNADAAEFPQLTSGDPEATALEPTETPLVELTVEPLTAPRPPAWLSVQVTLESEIEELERKRQNLQAALVAQQQAAENWNREQQKWMQEQQAWKREKAELNEQLSLSSQQMTGVREEVVETRIRWELSQTQVEETEEQIEKLRSGMEKAQAEVQELKSLQKDKSAQIGLLENEARISRQQIAELLVEKNAAINDAPRERDVEPLTRVAELSNQHRTLLVPPLPEDSHTASQDGDSTENSQPIIPRFVDQPDPPLGIETSVETQYDQSYTPLIAAEVGFDYGDISHYPNHTICCDTEPRKKGLIYDLKDWYHDWHDSEDSCATCEPLCTASGLCTETEEDCSSKPRLIPNVVKWWRNRHDDCHCGVRCNCGAH